MGFETRTTLFMANRGDSATAIGPTSLSPELTILRSFRAAAGLFLG
jgi:hypothetical protein